MVAKAMDAPRRAEVRSGRLDGDAAEAVLTAAGHRVRRRAGGVAGLTARGIEVLRRKITTVSTGCPATTPNSKTMTT